MSTPRVLSILMETYRPLCIQFLTGNFPLSDEMQSFWMAVQGAMIIRTSRNADKSLHWFHSFCLSVIAGYAGGWFGFILMAKPTSMFYNDLNMASCILAFGFVNYLPYDIGFKLCNTFPLNVVTVSFAQLFRSTAIPRFVNVCFNSFADNPSAYYPVPVFGPIMYAALLGNMGGFFTKGFEGYIKDGMPWAIQNGLATAGFYHFYVNDRTGIIGTTLRSLVAPLTAAFVGHMDDATFGACTVTLFMQVMGILQMPYVWGPSYSPFYSAFQRLRHACNTTTISSNENTLTAMDGECISKSGALNSSQSNSVVTATVLGKKKKKKLKRKSKEE